MGVALEGKGLDPDAGELATSLNFERGVLTLPGVERPEGTELGRIWFK